MACPVGTCGTPRWRATLLWWSQTWHPGCTGGATALYGLPTAAFGTAYWSALSQALPPRSVSGRPPSPTSPAGLPHPHLTDQIGPKLDTQAPHEVPPPSTDSLLSHSGPPAGRHRLRPPVSGKPGRLHPNRPNRSVPTRLGPKLGTQVPQGVSPTSTSTSMPPLGHPVEQPGLTTHPPLAPRGRQLSPKLGTDSLHEGPTPSTNVRLPH